MPYIPEEDRQRVEDHGPESVGDLTYVIFKAAVTCLVGSSGRYADRAAILAAMECAKLEFYRRFLADYEEQKMLENGDV